MSSSEILGDYILDVKRFLSLILASVSLSVKMAVTTIFASEVEGLYFLACSEQPWFMPVAWCSINGDSFHCCSIKLIVIPFTLRGVLIWWVNLMVTLLD